MIYIIELNQCYEVGGGKIIGYTKEISVAEKLRSKYDDNEDFYVSIIQASEIVDEQDN